MEFISELIFTQLWTYSEKKSFLYTKVERKNIFIFNFFTFFTFYPECSSFCLVDFVTAISLNIVLAFK